MTTKRPPVSRYLDFAPALTVSACMEARYDEPFSVPFTEAFPAASSEALSLPPGHRFSCATGSRSTGQVMHLDPPRPRPSSLPGMVMTSMPRRRR